RRFRAGSTTTGFVDRDYARVYGKSGAAFQGHVHVLDLGARQELFDRLFAPDARLLVAAEGHADPMLRRAVDPDKTGFDLRRQPVRAIEIVGPDRAGQSNVERVDALEQIVFVGPAQDAHDRPEDLLAGDPHVVGDVGEHRRLDEEPVSELRIRRALAAAGETRAAVEPQLDVAHRLVELGLAR